MNEEQTWLTKRIVLIVVCLICLIQLANAYTITTFTDGTTSGNLTYTTGTEWYNKALNIPNGKTATNAYIYLTGYLGIPKQSFNNDGNNETTYSGLWDIKSGNLYNPERTNDLDINTYARTDSPPAVLGSYRINFTLNSTHTADINITVRILTDSLTGNIIYCKNLSNNNWVQLSDISSKTDIRNMIVQASQSCFINSSLLQLNISVAGVYSQIYEVWINSSYQQYPTNSTIILNNNTVIFNYGNTNGTELNHTVLANFTTYLSGVVGYPQNFSFRSNTSGILEYSGLYVSYASTINITFFDEDTLVSLSGQNLTVVISTNTSESTGYTTNGTYSSLQNANGQFTIKASNANYSERSLVVDNTGDNIVLIMYLTRNQSTVTFTVKDEDTSNPLENSLLTMYRYIGGVQTIVTSRLTDVTGKAVISFIPNTRYDFVISKDGYNTKTFTLDPIKFATYTVSLTRTSEGQITEDLYGILYRTVPLDFYEGVQNNVTTTYTSPNGILTSYNVTYTYPGGTTSNTGSSSHGGVLTNTFTINNITNIFTDVINITYAYGINDGRTRNFSKTYTIIRQGTGMHTMKEIGRNTYGLGLFERILIITISVIIAAGFATYFGGAIAGGVIALFMYGYFTTTGFIPIYVSLPSMIIGFFLVAKGSGGSA